MDYSRRDLGLVSLLAAAAAKATAASNVLPSQMYRFEDLPVKVNGKNRARAVLKGETHAGLPLDMHMTELGLGQMPHPPHHHVHEEMILIQSGTVEVTIAGKKSKLGPGSSAYIASNEEHSCLNIGEGPALYFVLAIGSDS